MNKLSTWLISELKHRGWSQRELGRRAETSHTTISEVISGQRAPTYDFCAAIATPLERSPIEMFQLAGLIPDLSEDDWTNEVSLLELVEITKRLSYQDRLELLRYAKFREQDSDQGGNLANAST